MDKEKIKQAVAMLIEAIGEDPKREGLIETPERVAKMYEEIFGGYGDEAELHLAKTFTSGINGIVLERDIPFFSTCEHHIMPFFGVVHIAYIPQGRVVGLSKLARTVDVYAKRLQLQEKLTGQIAEAVMRELNTRGVMVIIEAEHTCMTMRGVKKVGVKTMTAVALGEFERDRGLKDEVYCLLQKK